MNHPALAALLAVIFVSGAFGAGAAIVVSTHHPEAAAAAAALFPQKISLQPGALEATAAILYDPTTGVILFQKDAREALPLASLTKLMSAYTVLSARDPSTEVTITEDDLAPDGDWGLAVGDTLLLSDLLRLGLVASCNDCMAAAVSSLGEGYLSVMNRAAMALGLSKTYFLNPTGLDLDAQTAGAYGSAYDVARLAAAFFQHYPQYFEFSTQPSVEIPDGDHQLEALATTLPIQDIPGLVGAKTGYTDLAGGNLVAVFDIEAGHPIVAAVLHSSEDGRFEDVRALVSAARAAFEAAP